MTPSPRSAAENVSQLLSYARERVDSSRQGPRGGGSGRWHGRAQTLAVLIVTLLVVANSIAVVADPGDGTWSGEVHLTGEPATDGTEWTYGLADATAATEPNITLTGRTSTEAESASGTLASGDSLPVEVAGTHDPIDTNVSITGVETLDRETWTASNAADGETTAVEVGGNSDAKTANVTFMGVEQTTAESWSVSGASDGDTTSVTVDGNLPAANAEVTLTGVGSSSAETESGTVSPGESSSVTIDGNMDPADATLTATAPDTLSATQFGSSTTTANFVGADYNGNAMDAEARIDNPPATVTEIKVQSDESYDPYNDVRADVYLVEESPDGTVGEGTLVKSNWDPPSGSGTSTITLDSPVSPSSDTVSVEFETTAYNASSDGRYYYQINIDGDGPSGYYQHSNQGSNGPADVTLKNDPPTNIGATADDGTSASFGDFSEGESKTMEFSLSSDASSIDWSGSGADLDWTLEYTDRTGSEDPSVDVDDDGTAEVTYSGVLADGETHTESVSLDSGTRSVATSLTSGTVDWTISATERTGSEDPSVDVDGDGSPDASYSGVLAAGETVTQDLDLTPGSRTVSTSLTAGMVNWELAAEQRTITEDATVQVDGTEITVDGTLSPGQTVTRETSALGLDTSQVNVSTASGSHANVSLAYREQTKTVDPRVLINGNALDHNGVLDDGETTTLNGSTNLLQEGENTVRVLVSRDVSASAPAPAVGVDYHHRASVTHESRRSDHGLQDDYAINHTFVDDREDAALQLSVSPRATGFKTLQIDRGAGWTDLSESDYELSDGTLTVDLGTVSENETVRLNATAWKVRTNDGKIEVVERTPPGESLDSRIEIVEKGDDFYIRTENSRVHYSYNESYDARDRVRVLSSGEQRVLLPEAQEGSTLALTKSPLEVNPETGDVVVEFESVTGDNPQFRVEAGRIGGDTVEYRWHQTISGHRYTLWSMTFQSERGSTIVGSEAATWTDDDNPETLQVVRSEEGGPGTGLSGASVWATFLELLRGGGFVVIGAGGILGLFFAGEYYEERFADDSRTADYASWGLSGLGTVILVPILIETMNPGSVSDRLGIAVSNAVATAIETVIGPIGIIGVVGLIVVGWSATQAWQKSQTDDEPDIVIDGGQK